MLRNLVLTILLSTPALLCAHHSVALVFSQERITLEGSIKELKWINPHSSFVLEITKEDGTKEEWLVELLARIALERGGWSLDELQNGWNITLTGRVGYRERVLRFVEARLPDGRTLRERSPLDPSDKKILTN